MLWKTHIDIISSIITQFSGILNRLKIFLPIYLLRTLYCSMFLSRLTYGILDLLTISDLFNLNCLKFEYKFKNKKLPLYFLDFECVPRSEIHDHDTRYAHLIDSITTRTVMAEKCMRHHLANIINECPRIIMEKINSHSINGFIFFTKRCYVERYR